MNGIYLENQLGLMKYRRYLWESERERNALQSIRHLVMNKRRGALKTLYLSLLRLGLF